MAGMFDEPPSGPTVGRYPISGLVRRARRLGDLSQRQMARSARTSPGTVGKVEAGTLRPSADRRYPAHLDTIIDPGPGEWWGDIYGLVPPPETFHRNRGQRDAQRQRSQWEVRVARHRNAPPPPWQE